MCAEVECNVAIIGFGLNARIRLCSSTCDWVTLNLCVSDSSPLKWSWRIIPALSVQRRWCVKIPEHHAWCIARAPKYYLSERWINHRHWCKEDNFPGSLPGERKPRQVAWWVISTEASKLDYLNSDSWNGTGGFEEGCKNLLEFPPPL